MEKEIILKSFLAQTFKLSEEDIITMLKVNIVKAEYSLLNIGLKPDKK